VTDKKSVKEMIVEVSGLEMIILLNFGCKGDFDLPLKKVHYAENSNDGRNMNILKGFTKEGKI